MTLTVSDFWDHIMRRWDEGKVRRTFNVRDSELILKIKVYENLPDTYAWGLSKSGVYNTQSGYKLADDLQENQDETVQQLSPLQKKLWGKLFKIQTTPKIRHFLWRALA